MTKGNPFKYDSWEWHAYEVAWWIDDSGFFSEDLEDQWNQVFVENPDLDWPIKNLGRSGMILAERHRVPQTNTMREAVLFLAAKQRDYGNQNILKFGVEGIKVRTSDKVERIKNLLNKDRDGSSEPIGDAYFDLWGYMVVLRMTQLNVFTKPLQDDMTEPEPPVSTETIAGSDPIVAGSKIILQSTGEWTEDGLYAIYKVVKYRA